MMGNNYSHLKKQDQNDLFVNVSWKLSLKLKTT